MSQPIIQAILAPNPSIMTGAGTNTYIIAQSGATAGCFVVDTGCDSADHLQKLRQIAAAFGGVSAIIVTHAHPDHIGGAKEFSQLTGAPVWALDNSASGTPFAARVVRHKEQISVGSVSITIVAIPGHRFDHLGLWLPDSGDLLVGDVMSGSGSVIIIPPEGDMAKYLQTLRKLAALPIQRIFPGHGPVIEDPQARIAWYIEHRMQRENMIISALRSHGPSSAADLLPLVYNDTPKELWPAAELSLMAHLLKLKKEQRAHIVAELSGAVEYWALIHR